MSIVILNEVYSEVRRLSIAGSMVAPGDFRLQKLIDPLRKAGEKAPVFQRVADGVQQVVQATEKTAANALLDLAALLTSILYTQGTTGIEGKLDDLPPSPITTKQTQTSARVLKPLLEALTSTGSGRFEQIKTAHELGLFNDLRLVRPALLAIDDSYSEIRDLIADKVLPTYGRAILPELQNAFDVSGKAGHGRRLKLMHRIAPEETRESVMRALEEGSKEVKIVAIECLGDSEEDLSFLLEQAKAKSKEVRAAALLSLGRLQHATAEDRLLEVMDSKDVDLLQRVAVDVAPAKLLKTALQRAHSELLELLKLSKKPEQGLAVRRLQCLIKIGTAKMGKDAEQFLRELLEQATPLAAIKSDPGGNDLVWLALERLAEGSPKAVDYLVERREQFPAEQWHVIVQAARRLLTPPKFFDLFSPYLNSTAKKKSVEAIRSETVLNEVAVAEQYFYYFAIDLADKSHRTPLDPRWLDVAISKDLPSLVYTMAAVTHKALHQYLRARWDSVKSGKSIDDRLFVAKAMVDSKHPDAVAIVLSQLDANKSSTSQWYQANGWSRIAAGLPVSVIPHLEAIIANPKTNNHRSDTLLETIQTIRERGAAK